MMLLLVEGSVRAPTACERLLDDSGEPMTDEERKGLVASLLRESRETDRRLKEPTQSAREVDRHLAQLARETRDTNRVVQELIQPGNELVSMALPSMARLPEKHVQMDAMKTRLRSHRKGHTIAWQINITARKMRNTRILDGLNRDRHLYVQTFRRLQCRSHFQIESRFFGNTASQGD
jgi:hypothetical protein